MIPSDDLLMPQTSSHAHLPRPTVAEGPKASAIIAAMRTRPPKASSTIYTWTALALDLLALPTAPFHEHHILRRVQEHAEEAGYTVRTDRWGNLMIDIPAAEPVAGPPLVLSAHTDHPGFWALRMLDDHKMLAGWIGRVAETYFAGSALRFSSGDPVLGDPASPPARGHVTKVREYRGEGDHALVEVAIDRPVAPGSIGQWDLPGPEVIDGRIHAPAIDDVAGVAALVCVMKELAEKGAARPVSLVFTRAEEAGFVGCIGYCRDEIAAGRRGAAQVVGIEMSKAMGAAEVGGGPVVRVGDRHSIFDPAVTDDCAHAGDLLRKRDSSFRYQRKLMDGGTCESSVFQGYLGRSGAVCVPLGNYHNIDEDAGRIDREYIDVGDFHGLIRLLLQIIESPVSEATSVLSRPLVDWCDDLWARHEHLLFDPSSSPKGGEA
ncbi:MAG: M20/M25/M40 family metallo-hydrolase [Planctomycetota bacterium]